MKIWTTTPVTDQIKRQPNVNLISLFRTNSSSYWWIRINGLINMINMTHILWSYKLLVSKLKRMEHQKIRNNRIRFRIRIFEKFHFRSLRSLLEVHSRWADLYLKITSLTSLCYHDTPPRFTVKLSRNHFNQLELNLYY